MIVTAPSQPQSFLTPSLPRTPATYPDALLEDGYSRLSFDFFRTVSVPEFARFFGRSFWSQSLLNTSHQFPAVMSAMLALSSLHRCFKDGKSLRDDAYAGRQYDRSLKQLIRAISNTADKSYSRLMSLLCGIIFTVIEVLHGSYTQALLHLDSIVQLLNERPQAVATAEEVLIGDAFLRDLRAVIFRFDIEGALYSTRRPLRLALSPLETKPLPEPYTQSPSLELDKIEDELTKLMGYMSQLCFNTQSYRYITPGDVPIHLLHEQQTLTAHFLHWWENSDAALLELIAGGTDSANQPEWTRRATLLRIHYHTAWTMLQGCIHAHETAYDQYLDNFAQIVQYVAIWTEIERSDNDLFAAAVATETRGLFSPETGIVFPLYWTAIRCRDGKLRRQALSQLRLCAREGVWNPEAQTKVAARIIEIEEGLEPWSILEAGEDDLAEVPSMEDIYEFRRCHRVIWPTDRVNRRVNMIYDRRPNGMDGEWDTGSEWVDY